MDTRVLKYFLTVAQTNNITKAAEQLHITQPTLSRQIMDLETELDIKLFNRENRRLQLTKAGILFQQRATTMLQLLDQTENDLHQQEEALTGEINLGSAVSSVSPYITKLIFEFQKIYPNDTTKSAPDSGTPSYDNYGLNYVGVIREFTNNSGTLYNPQFLGYTYGNDARVLNFNGGMKSFGTWNVSANVFYMAHGTFDMFTIWDRVGGSTGSPLVTTPTDRKSVV